MRLGALLTFEPGQYPPRVHRKRTKGWRKPPGALWVGRPPRPGRYGPYGRYGNPFIVGQTIHIGPAWSGRDELVRDREHAVTLFYRWVRRSQARAALAAGLRGRSLMCSCSSPQPGQPDWCHAAVWIVLANTPLEGPAPW